MKNVSARAAITAGVIVLLALTVGVASGAKLTTKTATTTLPPDDVTHAATAKCPKGAKATGGGGQLTDPDNDYFQGSYPAGKRKWTATAARPDTFVGDEALTAFARCLKGAKLSMKSASTTLPDDSDAHSITAKCPKGTKVSGGGVKVSNDDYNVAEPDGSFPSGNREWTAVGEAYEPGVELTATARCLADAKLVRKSETATLPGDATTHLATARCPRRTKATGGGVELSDPYDDFMAEGSYPTGKREWTAGAYRNPSVTDTEFTAHVVCLKKPKKK
jgi:hypothetical protein